MLRGSKHRADNKFFFFGVNHFCYKMANDAFETKILSSELTVLKWCTNSNHSPSRSQAIPTLWCMNSCMANNENYCYELNAVGCSWYAGQITCRLQCCCYVSMLSMFCGCQIVPLDMEYNSLGKPLSNSIHPQRDNICVHSKCMRRLISMQYPACSMSCREFGFSAETAAVQSVACWPQIAFWVELSIKVITVLVGILSCCKANTSEVCIYWKFRHLLGTFQNHVNEKRHTNRMSERKAKSRRCPIAHNCGNIGFVTISSVRQRMNEVRANESEKMPSYLQIVDIKCANKSTFM